METDETHRPESFWNPAKSGASPDISVIIVNWNSKKYLRSCLKSLAIHPPSATIEVVVVDGGSFDGCDQMLATEFPTVIFIQSPDNVGFARSNNLGARKATGRYLLLLNPDTEWIDDSFETLWQNASSLSSAGAIGCRLLNHDRTLQSSCVQSFPTAINQALDSELLRKLFPRSSLWGTAPLHEKSRRPAPAEAISGACILVKREFFEAVGGFSEDYFMYGEDLDLCFKLTRSGHRSFYVTDAQLVHHGGGSTGQASSNFSTIMMRISVHHFIRKHHGAAPASIYRTLIAVSALIRLACICPLLIFGNRIVTHGSASLQKWRAILKWSLGLGQQVAQPRTVRAASTTSISAEAN